MDELKQYIVIAKAGHNLFFKVVNAKNEHLANLTVFNKIIEDLGKPFRFSSFAIQIPFIRRKVYEK